MFCSDLFLTDAFLIKGNVEHKYTRLSKLLDEHRKTFIRVRDCTLIDLGSRDQIHTPLLHMNIDEVLVAHEFLDEAGDNAMADLAKEPDLDKVRIFYTGNLNVELAGYIRPGAYEITDSASRRFFVMRDPELRGFNHRDDDDLRRLTDLSYAIVNKERLSYVYDFN
ncbi:MAG: hypothetical protein AAF726_02245 [Planctomycetota bacterium]